MTEDGSRRRDPIIGTSAEKSSRRGRPLSGRTLAIRNAILELPERFDRITVRGAFYQLAVAGVVPKDDTTGYRPVQRQILLLRREGLLPWSFVADSTRWMRKPETYDEVNDAIASIGRTYRRNLWRSQNYRLEIWLEKDALASLIVDETDAWDVPLMVSRGTSSATFLYEAGRTARKAYEETGAETVVYALYDHDAGGKRAARNVEKGLREHAPDVPLRFEFLAVTDEQVEAWKLPTRPAKANDPEAKKFKGPAVELDAIPPDRLIDLVGDAIASNVDEDAWRKELLVEENERETLRLLLDRS